MHYLARVLHAVADAQHGKWGPRELDTLTLQGSKNATRPGKHTKNYRKSQFFMGKSTISMAIFNSKLLVYQRVNAIPSY